MFKSWLYLLALIFILSGCDSPTESTSESLIVSDINLPVPDLTGSIDFSSFVDGPDEFQFVPDYRPCDPMSIDPGSEIDYKLVIIEPDNSVDYTLKIVNPDDSWCIADLDSDLDFQSNLGLPSN